MGNDEKDMPASQGGPPLEQAGAAARDVRPSLSAGEGSPTPEGTRLNEDIEPISTKRARAGITREELRAFIAQPSTQQRIRDIVATRVDRKTPNAVVDDIAQLANMVVLGGHGIAVCGIDGCGNQPVHIEEDHARTSNHVLESLAKYR
jgi:hypothetical protein